MTMLLLAASPGARATLITINASDYAVGTDVSSVAPGATLSTYTSFGTEGVRLEPVTVAAFHLEGNDEVDCAFVHFPISRNLDTNFIDAQGARRCIMYSICESQYFAAMQIAFDQPTDYVEVHALFGNDWIDNALLFAFDQFGNNIENCRILGAQRTLTPRPPYLEDGTRSNPCGEMTDRWNCDITDSLDRCSIAFNGWISLTSPEIAFVVLAGECTDCTPIAIDSISYNANVSYNTKVPEPSTLSLMAFAIIGLGMARRRKPARKSPRST